MLTGKNGSVWYADKIDLEKDFDLEFYMNFGTLDGGADGIVFVLQDKGNRALGQAGGGLGYEGFSPSFGVEFDDFQNSSDPAYDHIGVFRDGAINHTHSNSLHAPVPALKNAGNIEDGKDHLVRIRWDASSWLLEVYFDCEKRLSLNYDIQERVFSGKKEVYWGFTASTGGLNNNQTVCLRRDILTADTVPICKGDKVPLNSRKSVDDVYKWSPATDLNDPTVKRPICSSIVPREYIVEFTDLCGEKIKDTVNVVIHTPFVMDEAQDTLLCDGKPYKLDLRADYDSVLWSDGSKLRERWMMNSGYYKFRAWKGACWDDDSFNIRTDISPRVKIIGDSVFCKGDVLELRLEVEPKDAEFAWHTGLTDTSHIPTQTELAWVRARNDCGVAENWHPVREIDLPTPKIEGESIYCDGRPVDLQVTNFGSHDVNWTDGESGTMRQVDSGVYIAEISDHHCAKADTINIGYRPTPEAQLPELELMCEFEPLFLKQDQVNTNVRWSTGSTVSEADYTLESGDHWVVVYNECGIDSQSFFIERKLCTCDLLVPSAITPNSDELNDALEVFDDCDKLKTYHLKIYNRWGQLLFSSIDITQTWDGTYQGEAVPLGAYFWELSYSGIEGRDVKIYHISGSLHVLH